jgi:hypothetical protein
MTQEKIIDTSNFENFREQFEKFEAPKSRGLKIPYILWGKWNRVYRPDVGGIYKVDIEYSVEAMMFRSVAPTTSKIMMYKNKGYRVLDFWFPTKAELPNKKPDQIVEAGWIGMLRNSEDGNDPYSEARSLCRDLKNAFFGKHEDAKQIASLKQELEELRAKQNEQDTNTRASKARGATKQENQSLE